MKRNLEEALKRIFPGEDVDSLAEIARPAAEHGRIYYNEIVMTDDVKVDLLLLLEKERMLIPFRTSKTISWEDRLLTFEPREAYEMPHVVRNLIMNAEETGEWNPDYAVERYLMEIGEREAEEITSFFNEVKEHAEQNRITAETMLAVAEEFNLVSRMGVIIAELKGGGVISPCLRIPSRLVYEINPSLIM